MKRILIIDDDRAVGEAIQMMLTRHGYDALLAFDADAGFKAFDTAECHAVIVDIFMPGTNGLETIAAFRKRAPKIPILAMSGFRFCDSVRSEMDFLRIAIELGATACLRKPFGPRPLMAAINSGFDSAFSNECPVESGKDKDTGNVTEQFGHQLAASSHAD